MSGSFYPLPRVTTERRNTTKWIRAASPPPPPWSLFRKQTGKKSRNSKETRWLWMTAREGESYFSLSLSPPSSLCVYNVCGMCKEEKKGNWGKLSQLCLSSDRWLMNCERSLSVSIQSGRITYSAAATWCDRRFFFFLFENGGLVMQPNNLPSIDDERI